MFRSSEILNEEEKMNYFSRVLAVILLSLSLSACEGAQKIQEETEKRFVQNPHPKQAYRITVKVNDAPGL